MSSRIRIALAAIVIPPVVFAPSALSAQRWDLASEVEIRRTEFGVPHVLANTLAGAGFGLAYAQAEDHGDPVFMAFLEARGVVSAVRPSAESVESDFRARMRYQRAVETYGLLSPELREFMEGFAHGVNHYLALHPEERPGGRDWAFTGEDVHAFQIGSHNARLERRFLERVQGQGGRGLPGGSAGAGLQPEDGSNVWALAPSRTAHGHAILMRNPHLSWDAGYYEAHLRVPGLLDFYGDFRIGGLFGIVCGFNPHLGWSTTNNYPDLDEIYALELDPARTGHYRFGGGSIPMERRTVMIEVADSAEAVGAERGGPPPSLRTHARTFEFTEIGPVIHRDGRRVYVLRSANDGEHRRGEQLFRMMRASNLDEWLAAMRMQAISASNYTYADREGNIFYVWNAKLPLLPHEAEDDTPVAARGWSDVWSGILPFDRLPQLLNPEGGYLRNENDPPYFTNLFEPLSPDAYPSNLPEPRLRLRSQHSLELLHNDRRFNLEDVVELKHSPRMELADRVKQDLVNAVRVSDAGPEVRAAADLLDAWDNTASTDSRGSVLFSVWWDRYTTASDSSRHFREAWSPERPTDTPMGLGSLTDALTAFRWAVGETRARHGTWDVAWGDVHRVRHGNVDAPAAGCPSHLGCFRVLSYEPAPDGTLVASRGDAWVFAVEFGDVPRAYSVLAYGQSARESSPHFDDQANLFVNNQMKQVAFTEEDIERALIARYRPGEERAGR